MSYGILCHYGDVLDDTSYGIRWTNIDMDGWMDEVHPFNGPKHYLLLLAIVTVEQSFFEQCIESPFNHYLTHKKKIKKTTSNQSTSHHT